ncbi:uncharacterized protein B0I36DRAFT_434672 [Microdochium trichocladiopsis]|uniref:Zn(2)-C6 fungal-type domain-containing protein n=1 Tax=Microdochium trichocladiopsis TaxID=1682393 RepID=A0A9P9BLT4_9PEZI|nr:uncharacterized protein B0I36DRAFT_434672 [Microdochium trichocladiopsis]KAH7025224.1 hypothetical protein B0I36DRAFT_434672 [Microdochium trichocladiopsis]
MRRAVRGCAQAARLSEIVALAEWGRTVPPVSPTISWTAPLPTMTNVLVFLFLRLTLRSFDDARQTSLQQQVRLTHHVRNTKIVISEVGLNHGFIPWRACEHSSTGMMSPPTWIQSVLLSQNGTDTWSANSGLVTGVTGSQASIHGMGDRLCGHDGQRPIAVDAFGGRQPARMRPPMRSSIACLRCRKSKIKCENDSGSSPCEGCIKTGQQCIFQPPEGNPPLSKRNESPAVAQKDREGGSDRKRLKRIDEIAKSDAQKGTTYAKEVLSAQFLTEDMWDQLLDLYKLHFAEKLGRRLRSPSTTDVSPEFNLVLLGVLALTARFHVDLVKYLAPITNNQPGNVQSRPMQTQVDPSTASDYYAEILSMALGPIPTTASVERVQAMLMLGLYQWGQTRPETGVLGAWISIGGAIRLAQFLKLGLVDEPNESASARAGQDPSQVSHWIVEREVMRRTMFGCFVMDRMLACGKGRVTMIQREELCVQLPCSEEKFDLAIEAKTRMLPPRGCEQDERRGINDDSVLSRFICLVDIWADISRKSSNEPEGFWNESAEHVFRAAKDISALIEMCERKNCLPQSTLVLFGIWTAAFVGLYAHHFPQMDEKQHMGGEQILRNPNPLISLVDLRGAAAVAYSTLDKMSTSLKMASTYMSILLQRHRMPTKRVRESGSCRSLDDEMQGPRLGDIGANNSVDSERRQVNTTHHAPIVEAESQGAIFASETTSSFILINHTNNLILPAQAIHSVGVDGTPSEPWRYSDRPQAHLLQSPAQGADAPGSGRPSQAGVQDNKSMFTAPLTEDELRAHENQRIPWDVDTLMCGDYGVPRGHVRPQNTSE